jgi:hypothetical protein
MHFDGRGVGCIEPVELTAASLGKRLPYPGIAPTPGTLRSSAGRAPVERRSIAGRSPVDRRSIADSRSTTDGGHCR